MMLCQGVETVHACLWQDFASLREFCRLCHLSVTRLRLNKVVECHVLKDSLLKIYSNKRNQYVQVKDVHLKREAIIKALCPHVNDDDGFLVKEYMHIHGEDLLRDQHSSVMGIYVGGALGEDEDTEGEVEAGEEGGRCMEIVYFKFMTEANGESASVQPGPSGAVRWRAAEDSFVFDRRELLPLATRSGFSRDLSCQAQGFDMQTRLAPGFPGAV
ncbi:hypothetical protein AOLI_G00174590 [Acnodon oligacanthus]